MLFQYVAVLLLTLIIVLQLEYHDKSEKHLRDEKAEERAEWIKERAELLDRIQSVDYLAFKTIKTKETKVDKEKKLKPPELV